MSVRVCDISELSLVLRYQCNLVILIFFCVVVMYPGEYDVCDVTLSVYPHRCQATFLTSAKYLTKRKGPYRPDAI